MSNSNNRRKKTTTGGGDAGGQSRYDDDDKTTELARFRASLTPDQLRTYRKHFEMFDLNGDGSIRFNNYTHWTTN